MSTGRATRTPWTECGELVFTHFSGCHRKFTMLDAAKSGHYQCGRCMVVLVTILCAFIRHQKARNRSRPRSSCRTQAHACRSSRHIAQRLTTGCLETAGTRFSGCSLSSPTPSIMRSVSAGSKPVKLISNPISTMRCWSSIARIRLSQPDLLPADCRHDVGLLVCFSEMRQPHAGHGFIFSRFARKSRP